jgi:AcrR family transcriptional regulator
VGRRKRTEVRQEEIAHSVLELIASEGHEALSMMAVAKRIGVVPSALYRHFPSKEDMIIAAMRLHREEKVTELDGLIAEHQSIIQAYQAYVRKLPQFLGQTSALPRISFGIMPNASERLRSEVRIQFSTVLDKITQDFELAKEHGEISPDVDCLAAANSLWGLLVTGVIRYSLLGEEYDIAGHIQRGWEFFLRTVRPPAPAVSPNGANHRKKTPVEVRV